MVQYSEKGSKRMLQLLLFDEHHKKDLLEKLNEEVLKPISPKTDNGVFHEHQLNKTILQELKLKPDDLKNFWPSRQPQWDGILVNEKGNEDFDTVYLIEAKSHIGEIGSRAKPKKQSEQQAKNSDLISKSIQQYAKKPYGIPENENNDKWLWKYYQIANRLAFHQKLKVLYEERKLEIKVKLIFLNFINDLTWKKEGKVVEDEKKWNEKFDKIFCELGNIKEKLQDRDVEIITVDAINY